MTNLLPWLMPILFAPVGGSLVGVLVRRLPAHRPVLLARSHCESCGRTLSVPDLVPIASYLVFRGHCRTCRAAIDPFHLAIELAAVTIAVWAAAVESDPSQLWIDCLLGWGLLALAWIDMDHMRLPNALTLPLLAAGLSAQAAFAPDRFVECVLGAVIGYVAFRGIAVVYARLRGRDGLGAGDAKLLAVAGAWVGWAALPSIVFLASLLALGAVAIKLMRDQAIDGAAAIPFGPFLALAFWITYLHGPLGFLETES